MSNSCRDWPYRSRAEYLMHPACGADPSVFVLMAPVPFVTVAVAAFEQTPSFALNWIRRAAAIHAARRLLSHTCRPRDQMAMFSARPTPHQPLLGPIGMNLFFLLNCANIVIAFW